MVASVYSKNWWKDLKTYSISSQSTLKPSLPFTFVRSDTDFESYDSERIKEADPTRKVGHAVVVDEDAELDFWIGTLLDEAPWILLPQRQLRWWNHHTRLRKLMQLPTEALKKYSDL